MAEDREALNLSRRDVIVVGAALATAAGIAGPASAEEKAHKAKSGPAPLAWLDGNRAKVDCELVWGTPWPRGFLRPGTPLHLSADVKNIPIQSWPLAYWPDGTLKWMGHAARGPIESDVLVVGVGHPATPTEPVTVHEHADKIVVRSGKVACTIAKSGPDLITSFANESGGQFEKLRLVCLRQDRSREQEGVLRTEQFVSDVHRAVVEQSGPVRALVRIEGTHALEGGRRWLPFTVRVSLVAGGSGLKVTHSFVFDGDANTDFISGLGLRFEVPLPDELHNRHVRFAGEGTGFWGEAVRNLPGWTGKFELANRFADQLEGKAVPTLSQMDQVSRDQLATVPAWNDFKLYQSSAGHFDITKRTVPVASWLPTDHGARARGFGYVGGVSGGVGFGVRHFWQRHPTALEVNGATTSSATVTTWLWSPDAPPMDLRHYSDRAHGLEIQYEDVEPGHSTPHGIARTSEVLLWTFPSTPSRAELSQYAAASADPPRLICTPQRFQDCEVFGSWGLPDRSTPVKARLEAEHDRLLSFYVAEVDRRSWYGFWSFGDVMHTYDADRHCWRYDVGGYAWANSELVPDLWLWKAFLRSGRGDVFKMAEAMTRHTGEVDVYHLGPFAKLGSRHNVSHWGCGAKEARISQALLRRIYYYVTADERAGDLMREVVDADRQLVETDPLRHVLPPSGYPTHARSGPDWFAFAGNWLVEWERTGDVRWRDKIVHGLKTIAAMPRGMFSGPAFGYDPSGATLHHIGGDLTSSYHLVTIFGGAELVGELLDLVDAPDFAATWLHFCELYNAGEQARSAALGVAAPNSIFGYPIWHARLTAYAAKTKRDPALAARAWNEFLYGFHRTNERRFPMEVQRVDGPQVLAAVSEVPWIETNHASQWSLNLIELLAMIGEHAPMTLQPPWDA